jgi:hypothetical protein
MLVLDDGHAGVHVYRSCDDGFGTWVYPIEFDTETMGRIWIQPR